MCACACASRVYYRADERIRSCRCHVLAFPLEWRNATPLSYTSRLRSLSTLAAGIPTYVRTYVCSAGAGFDAFQRTRLLFRLRSARTRFSERDPRRDHGRCISRAFVRTGRRFLPVSSSFGAFYDVHRYPGRRQVGTWLVTSRKICGRSLFARMTRHQQRGADNSRIVSGTNV